MVSIILSMVERSLSRYSERRGSMAQLPDMTCLGSGVDEQPQMHPNANSRAWGWLGLDALSAYLSMRAPPSMPGIWFRVIPYMRPVRDMASSREDHFHGLSHVSSVVGSSEGESGLGSGGVSSGVGSSVWSVACL
jgi:hypothetical protein